MFARWVSKSSKCLLSPISNQVFCLVLVLVFSLEYEVQVLCLHFSPLFLWEKEKNKGEKKGKKKIQPLQGNILPFSLLILLDYYCQNSCHIIAV